MAYVYILHNLIDRTQYLGSTSDLLRRVKEHNSGLVRSTKNKRPWKLYAYQECSTLVEARLLESMYKRSHSTLERAIKQQLFIFYGV